MRYLIAVMSAIVLIAQGNAQVAPPPPTLDEGYRVTYSVGTATSTGAGGSFIGHGNSSLTGGTNMNSGNGSGMIDSGVAGPGSATVAGPLTATFTWQGDPTHIPEAIYIEEKTTAQWVGSSGSCDDGLGGKKRAIEHGEVSEGRRVRRFHTPGATFTLSVSPSASVNLHPAFMTYLNLLAGQCFVTYSASVKEYAVTIRSDRDETFRKGPDGPVSNLTNFLTPIFGDTSLDPDLLAVATGDPDVYHDPSCSVYFSRELIGGWTDPFHTWNLDGISFVDDFFNEYVGVNKTWWFTDDEAVALSENGPVSKIITLDVSDADPSITATALYTLRIHHPYENWRKVGDLPDIWQYTDPSYPGRNWTRSGGNIQIQFNRPDPMWKLATVTTKILGTQLKAPLWKAFFKTAEIGIDDLGPKAENESVGFEACWGKARSTIIGGDWNSPKTAFYMIDPQVATKFHVRVFEADGYGRNGFIGNVYEAATNAAGESEYVGTFVLQSTYTTEGGE